VSADFRRLLRSLSGEGVEFVIIGGVAVVAHGYPRATVDLDICYSRAAANLDAIVRALAPLAPRLRGAPPELPFIFDARTLRNGLNFTLETDAGAIDLLGEVTGVGGYGDLAPTADVVELYDHRVKIIGLELLERSKAAAGRAKDLLDLEAIRELRKG
jgi:predicted nucleotidyltransferase